MTLIAAVASLALLATVLYAVLGGADFGGGVWNLLATGPRREEQRTTITEAIGPVWEANHVWLIFLIVTLFTCFPAAFAAIATGVNTPLALALLGIVLRGSAFAFRNYAADTPWIARPWSIVFGSASIIAPFFFGTAVGGIATGEYNWTSPFALCIGLFAVALCAQLAAVFLLLETDDPRCSATSIAARSGRPSRSGSSASCRRSWRTPTIRRCSRRLRARPHSPQSRRRSSSESVSSSVSRAETMGQRASSLRRRSPRCWSGGSWPSPRTRPRPVDHRRSGVPAGNARGLPHCRRERCRLPDPLTRLSLRGLRKGPAQLSPHVGG